MWATKKQLRRDAELLKEDYEALKAEKEALSTEIRKLKTELLTAQLNGKEVPELRAMVKKLTKQIATKDDTIRKQTEADLLVNALQAVGIIPKPPSGENVFDYFKKAAELQSLLADSNLALQQQQALERHSFSNPGPGLGAALFGRGF